MKFRSRFQAVMWAAMLLSLACFLLFQWGCATEAGALFPVLRVTALTCFYHFAVRLMIGEWLVPRFVEPGINPRDAWFQPRRWEAKLYRKLNVQRRKRAMPTYDPAEFDLQQLGPEALVRSTCRAEVVHEINAVASFAPLLFTLRFGAFWPFLITSIAAAGVDLAFAVIQRYNRPRLVRLAKMRARKEKKHESDA